jgi:hypothetical protein
MGSRKSRTKGLERLILKICPNVFVFALSNFET